MPDEPVPKHVYPEHHVHYCVGFRDMEPYYALHGLQDVWSSHESYRNKEYPICALLAVTPADTQIFPDLLLHLNELHSLTGKDMLVVAPKISLEGNRTTEDTLTTLRSGVLAANGRKKNISREVDDFLLAMTKESYRALEFFGEAQTTIPAFIFFDQSDYTEGYVLWPLKDLSSSEIISHFRHIISYLRDACQFELEREIQQIHAALEELARARSSNNRLRHVRPSPFSLELRRRLTPELAGQLKAIEDAVWKLHSDQLTSHYQSSDAMSSFVQFENELEALETEYAEKRIAFIEAAVNQFRRDIDSYNTLQNESPPSKPLDALTQCDAITLFRREFGRTPRKLADKSLSQYLRSANKSNTSSEEEALRIALNFTGTKHEGELIRFLEGLTPSDFSRILARLPGIDKHMPDGGTHFERVAAMVRRMRSSSGPGLEHLAAVLDDLFPDRTVPK